jgi:DNA primase
MAGGGYDLEEIRRRADIVEIISPHVALRKAGRRLVGLCPFHQERTPSFTVDPEAGLWHCFGCKAGGDLFRFVEMVEKVEFTEAVELLARRLGVQPKSPEQAGRQRERERLLAIYEAACKFFQAQLRTEAAGAARGYLKKRGLAPVTIEGFAIGYAPDSWDGLLIAMGRRGYSGQELARAGLVIPREGGFYDRFRDRIIFPINDSSGRVIAFGGRSLSDEQQPKYLNSPDSPIFQKGHVLYAFDRARRAMSDSGQAMVVEGYLDAIACHDAGSVETVATMGTALTPEHVEMLRRRVSRLVLAFDSDSAGMAAALRSRDLFQQADLTVRVITLPEGLDPDQVVRERGRDAFADLVSAAVPMIEWELARILDSFRQSRDTEEFMRQGVAILAGSPDGKEREYYLGWLVKNLASDSTVPVIWLQNALHQEVAKSATRRTEPGRRTDQSPSAGGLVNKQAPASKGLTGVHADLLAALITHGEAGRPYAEQLHPEDFPGEARDIFIAVRSLMDGGQTVSAQAVLAAVPTEARSALAQVMLAEVPEERVEEAIASATSRIVEARLKKRVAELSREFSQANTKEEQERIERELSEARRRRSELAGQRLVGEE